MGAAPAEGGTASVTQEIEIMRGDITRIFANAAKSFPKVTYRYGCTVSEIRQSRKSVFVVFNDSDKVDEFSAVIGADGLASKVRKLIFDTTVNDNCYCSTDTNVAFYSIPGDPNHDLPNARLQQGNKGRAIWIRPMDREATRASCYLLMTGHDGELEDVARKGTMEQKKAALESLFKEFRGMGSRAMHGMYESSDFYFTRIVQVKLDTWHDGRCGLVGDAGYCPSPLTGQGTTLAIMGAYILAGELALNPDDPEAALTEYQSKFEGFVKKAQQLPLWGLAPKLALPWTDWGVWAQRSFIWFISWTGVWKLFNFGNETMRFQLPQYEFVME